MTLMESRELPFRPVLLGLGLALALACGGETSTGGTGEPTELASSESAEEAMEDSGASDPASGAHSTDGLEVGGEKGVMAGTDGERSGFYVGGEKGVKMGSDDDAKGVKIGGDKGVLMGKDDKTSGLRIGGEKGVEIDGRKGLRIGGQTIIPGGGSGEEQ